MSNRRIIIIGNPNCGKTTLFNDLTGAHERVANYVGVTHGIQNGSFLDNFGQKTTVYDLPGAYGLSVGTSEDREIFDLLRHTDEQTRLLCVLDARSLERSLFLGTQLLELGLPICFAVHFSFRLQKQGHMLDKASLERALPAPVVYLSQRTAVRRRQLRDVVTHDLFEKTNDFHIPFLNKGEELRDKLAEKINLSSGWCGLLLLQDRAQRKTFTADHEELFRQTEDALNQTVTNWKTQATTARYRWIESVVSQCIRHVSGQRSSFDWDRVFLHPFWGLATMGMIAFSMLLTVFTLSEYPMRLCEWGIEALQSGLKAWLPDTWWRSLLTEGVLGGSGNVLLFLPQFVLVIACLGILENTGYLARVMFLLDRWMKKIGLSGSSFVALVSCYACTVPGIMQTRCVSNRQERLTTLFVAPWVNCASRVPIYLLLISLLFKDMTPCGKTLLVIAVYLTGLAAALALAAAIRTFFFKTRGSVSVAEVPPLLSPQWTYILKLMKAQTFFFLRKAGTVVLACSVALWLCLHAKITRSGETVDCVHWVGEKLEKVLRPIGFDGNLGIALLSSFDARENFISTLGVLYNADAKEPGCLREYLQQAKDTDGNPIYSFATCVSLILFFMFSLQCIGTLMLVKAEAQTWRLPLLQFVFMNGFAYVLCFVVYQVLR